MFRKLPTTIKQVLSAFFKLLPLSYSFFVYYFINSQAVYYIAIGLIAVMTLHSFTTQKEKSGINQLVMYQTIGVSLSILVFLFIKPSIVHLIYPALMSFSFMANFLYTIIYPPSMIERIARLRNHSLDEDGVIYTRNLTVVWAIFCGINFIISLMTVFIGNAKIWFWYNGVISYMLMGMLIFADCIYRYFIKQSDAAVLTRSRSKISKR